jgi:hypothetical protein
MDTNHTTEMQTKLNQISLLISLPLVPNKYGEISLLHPSNLFHWHPTHQKRNLLQRAQEREREREREREGGSVLLPIHPCQTTAATSITSLVTSSSTASWHHCSCSGRRPGCRCSSRGSRITCERGWRG